MGICREVDESINDFDIKAEIIRCCNSDKYIKLNNGINRKDIFSTLGISRKEKVHSKFIKWLLNPKEFHGLGEIPLKKFLQMLAIQKENDINKNAEITKDFLNCFIIGNYVIDYSDIEVEVEYPIQLKNSSYPRYLDVLIRNFKIIFNNLNDEKIEKNFMVIIENKVRSKEGDNQTIDYYNWAHYEENKDYCPICVFLYPKNMNTDCESKEFLRITYDDIVKYVIEPCLELIDSDLSRMFIKEYLKTLSYSIDMEGELIMAISQNEKDLCKDFISENEALFRYLLSAIRDDAEMGQGSEIYDVLDNMVDDKNIKRDNTKYKFNNQKYSKGRLALEIVQVAAKKYNTFSKIDGAMNNIFTKNSKLLVDSYTQSDADKDAKRTPRYFIAQGEEINLEKKYYLTSQWGTGNVFDELLKIANDKLKLNIEPDEN